MKNTVVVVSLFLQFGMVSIYGHEIKPIEHKNYLGVSLLTVKGVPSNFMAVPAPKYPLQLLNGFIYKRQISNSALRVLFSHRHVNDSHDPEVVENLIYLEKFRETSLRIGYERYLGKRKIQPYVALDLLLTNSNSEVRRWSLDGHWVSDFESTGYGIGISPSLGLAYNFSKRINLSVETSLDLIRYKSKISSRETKLFNGSVYNPIGNLSVGYRL